MCIFLIILVWIIPGQQLLPTRIIVDSGALLN